MKNGLIITSVKMKPDHYKRGDIWLMRLDPTQGSEIKKTRPCLVISRSKVNKYLNTVTVIPLTGGNKNASILSLNVSANIENGLKKDSHLEITQIRTVSKKRAVKKLGEIETQYLQRIKESFESYFWE